MTEEEPISQIVDAETFGYYLESYRADLLAEPSIQRIDLRKGMHKADKDSSSEDTYPIIDLTNIPWADVPEKLQRQISRQYDAALLNEEKAVDIILKGGNLQFELRSAHADGLTDTFGEYGAPGLRFQLTSPFGVPLWIVKKIPLSTTGGLLGIREKYIDPLIVRAEEDALFEEARYIVTQYPQEQPASLAELQDVARLLEKSKDKAVIIIT